MIVRDVFLGIRRFDAMQRDLGLTPHHLSHRLGKLVRDGILAASNTRNVRAGLSID